jgi:hypothetical protein
MGSRVSILVSEFSAGKIDGKCWEKERKGGVNWSVKDPNFQALQPCITKLLHPPLKGFEPKRPRRASPFLCSFAKLVVFFLLHLHATRPKPTPHPLNLRNIIFSFPPLPIDKPTP